MSFILQKRYWVHTHLPVRVGVWQQCRFVCTQEHHKTAVLPVHMLRGRPAAHNVIGRPEGEVVQVCECEMGVGSISHNIALSQDLCRGIQCDL